MDWRWRTRQAGLPRGRCAIDVDHRTVSRRPDGAFHPATSASAMHCGSGHGSVCDGQLSDLCPNALHAPIGQIKDFHPSAAIVFNCRELGNPRRPEMASAAEKPIKRTIRRQQLREMVPLADSTIYEMEQRGEFPRRFALSPRCVVWDLAEVEAWLASRRSSPIARAQSPDVRQRQSRPVRERGPAQTAALRTG